MRPIIEGDLEEAIDEVVEGGLYNTKGEFIRDACRRHLEKFDELPIDD